MLLGAVAPYAVRLSVRTVEEAGRVAGRLYAISTLGSLVGAFLSALVLIPLVGTRRTFLAFALALALAAVPGLQRRFVLAPVGVALLLAIPVGTVKATGDARVIWERETEYQYARVTERPNGERRLELNEGQAVHSVYRPGEWLTHDYWDEMLVLPFATTGRPPRSVAILGNAAGTTARAYGHYFPATRVDGVEIDPALTDVGRRLFDLRRSQSAPAHRRRAALPAARVAALGRDHRRRLPPALHPLLPGHARVLRRGARPPHARAGWCSSTSGTPRLGPPGEGPRRHDGPGRSPRPARSGQADQHRARRGPTRRPRPARSTRRRAAAPRPGSGGRRGGARGWRRRLPGGDVYTDDRAPVEWLIDASIVHVAAEGSGAR